MFSFRNEPVSEILFKKCEFAGLHSRKSGRLQIWYSQDWRAEGVGRCVCSLRQKIALWVRVFVIIFMLNVAPGTGFWKGLLQVGPVWACLSSLLGCFVLRLLLWASPSLDIEAHGQLIPNVRRHFFPACIVYFNFNASFVFKRLKKDSNSHVFGHSLNLQYIFFHLLWERDVCAWPWISPSYKAFKSGDLILLFMPHLCTIGANFEQSIIM